MTTTSPTDTSTDVLREQLEPVRVALLDDARSRASELLADARTDAETITAEAAAAVDHEVHRAEQRARDTARARSEQHLDQARAHAHEHILQTRAAIIDRVVKATGRAVLGLRDDPRYPDLLDHLERLAHHQLGPDADIDRDPADQGGLIARHGARRVDYTLATLADRALAQLGDDIERVST